MKLLSVSFSASLQEELYKEIISSLNCLDFKIDKEINWKDTALICHKTKQGVIKIKQWEEQFQKYACWRFTKKEELNFDNYEGVNTYE